jgi:HPt (histidine-containing phosphotransfer) domain-containing protein
MTAHAMKGDRERCLAAGCDGYVSKPIRSEELWRAIEHVRPGAATTDAGDPADVPRPKAFDREEALARVGGDEELLKELVGLFLEDYPGRLAELGRAVAAHDGRAVQRVAHSLKGAVGAFGARAASEAALRLEAMGRRGDLSGAEEAWAALDDALARLRPALAALAGEEG